MPQKTPLYMPGDSQNLTKNVQYSQIIEKLYFCIFWSLRLLTELLMKWNLRFTTDA